MHRVVNREPSHAPGTIGPGAPRPVHRELHSTPPTTTQCTPAPPPAQSCFDWLLVGPTLFRSLKIAVLSHPRTAATRQGMWVLMCKNVSSALRRAGPPTQALEGPHTANTAQSGLMWSLSSAPAKQLSELDKRSCTERYKDCPSSSSTPHAYIRPPVAQREGLQSPEAPAWYRGARQHRAEAAWPPAERPVWSPAFQNLPELGGVSSAYRSPLARSLRQTRNPPCEYSVAQP